MTKIFGGEVYLGGPEDKSRAAYLPGEVSLQFLSQFRHRIEHDMGGYVRGITCLASWARELLEGEPAGDGQLLEFVRKIERRAADATAYTDSASIILAAMAGELELTSAGVQEVTELARERIGAEACIAQISDEEARYTISRPMLPTLLDALAACARQTGGETMYGWEQDPAGLLFWIQGAPLNPHEMIRKDYAQGRLIPSGALFSFLAYNSGCLYEPVNGPEGVARHRLRMAAARVSE